jgi:hypothetical protein
LVVVGIRTDSTQLIEGILRLEPTRRLSLEAILCHPFFTSPRPSSRSVYVQDHRSNHTGFDSAPIPEETGTPTEERTSFFPPSAATLSESALFSTATIQSATSNDEHSLTTNQEGKVKPVDQNDRSSIDGMGSSKSSLSDINTLRRRHASSDNCSTQSVDDVTTSPVYLNVTAPSLRRNFSSTSTTSITSVGPTSRTPARTKRRSVGSMMSERLFSLDEEPGTTMIDYHSLLALPTPAPLSTESDRKLLDSLTTLGFDTGQMVHSVMTNACDSSGAVWWMLKTKSDGLNRDRNESDNVGIHVPPPATTSPSTMTPIRNPEPKKPLPTLVIPASTPPGTLSLDFVFGSKPSPTAARSALARSGTTTPPLSSSRLVTPITSPTNNTTSHLNDSLTDVNLTPTKSRANSINLLSRATTAIGHSLTMRKSVDIMKDVNKLNGGGDGPEGNVGGRSPGNSTIPLVRLFQRKLSDPPPPLPHSPLIQEALDLVAILPVERGTSPLRNTISLSPDGSPKRESTSPSQHSSTFDTVTTNSTLSTSPPSSTGSFRDYRSSIAFGSKGRTNKTPATKGNLFTNFRSWFGAEDRRKRKRNPVLGNHSESNVASSSTHQSPAIIRSINNTNGGRRVNNYSYVGSPLKRPPLSSRRSSTGTGSAIPSRQSSRASLHPHLDPRSTASGIKSSRRRSDASRRSTTSDTEAILPLPTSRPHSLRSFNTAMPHEYNSTGTLRRPTAGSSSSIGSGRSHSTSVSMNNGNGGLPYRRAPPTTTTVRRVHVSSSTAKGGRRPTRSRSATSSVMTKESSSDPIARGDMDDTGDEREREVGTKEPILEEDETDNDENLTHLLRGEEAEQLRMNEERQKALRRLSNIGDESSNSIPVIATIAPLHRPSISSLSGRSAHSSTGSVITLFTAHKSHHLFGAPSQQHLSSAPGSLHHHQSTLSSNSSTGAARHHHHHHHHHSNASHSHQKQSRHHRPALRDVFASKDIDGEWIDEDRERDYGGGLGQGGSGRFFTSPSLSRSQEGGGAGLDGKDLHQNIMSGPRYTDTPMPPMDSPAAHVSNQVDQFSLNTSGNTTNRRTIIAGGGTGGGLMMRSAVVEEEEEEEEEE